MRRFERWDELSCMHSGDRPVHGAEQPGHGALHAGYHREDLRSRFCQRGGYVINLQIVWICSNDSDHSSMTSISLSWTHLGSDESLTYYHHWIRTKQSHGHNLMSICCHAIMQAKCESSNIKWLMMLGQLRVKTLAILGCSQGGKLRLCVAHLDWLLHACLFRRTSQLLGGPGAGWSNELFSRSRSLARIVVML